MNPLARLADLIYAPWESRLWLTARAGRAMTDAARVVASLSPADAVEDYIHACMRGERLYRRWRDGITAVAGCVPGFMWAAGVALNVHYGWSIVAAQCFWFALWVALGEPYMSASLEENRIGVYAAALANMSQRVAPTLDQLNAASERLGLPARWRKPDSD